MIHNLTLPLMIASMAVQVPLPNPGVTPPAPQKPVVQPSGVPVVEGSTTAIHYRNLKSATMVDLKGTPLSPTASGVATLTGADDGIHISASFKNLVPASSFGGEFLTYVLWSISTEGRATNLGELLVKRGKSRIQVIESLQTFGLVVTAEPYFAVSQPSEVVILENTVGKASKANVEFIHTRYERLKRGQYTLGKAPLEPLDMERKLPFAVYQARNAVRIAKATGAPVFAPEVFGKAEDYLKKAEAEGWDQDRNVMAREAVQRAEAARLISVRHQATEQLTMERATAQSKLEEATRQGTQAAQAEAVARQEIQRAEADNDRLRSANEGLRFRNASMRSRLLEQLNDVLQTRATARGLIVNMAGVLFENGKADLLPAAREKLAKIAGILSTHKGLKIQADGFTDSNGSDELNDQLSEARARNTKDYLVSQGVAADSISYKGYGKANPIASNGTEAGRQENRRVELVVSGEGVSGSGDIGL